MRVTRSPRKTPSPITKELEKSAESKNKKKIVCKHFVLCEHYQIELIGYMGICQRERRPGQWALSLVHRFIFLLMLYSIECLMPIRFVFADVCLVYQPPMWVKHSSPAGRHWPLQQRDGGSGLPHRYWLFPSKVIADAKRKRWSLLLSLLFFAH